MYSFESPNYESDTVQVEIVTGNPGVSQGLPAPVPQQNPYPHQGYGFSTGLGTGFADNIINNTIILH